MSDDFDEPDEKYHVAKRVEHGKRIRETRSRYTTAAWIFFGGVFLCFSLVVEDQRGFWVVAAVGVMTFVAYKIYVHLDTSYDRSELHDHRNEEIKARAKKQRH